MCTFTTFITFNNTYKIQLHTDDNRVEPKNNKYCVTLYKHVFGTIYV